MGKIHTVEWTLGPVSGGHNYQMDVAKQLTSQLQRMVRQCQIFKLSGLTIQVAPLLDDATNDDVVVTGQVRWCEPTAGRIKAIKNAFFAVHNGRKDAGIPPNYEYDFRIGLDSGAQYQVTNSCADGELANQAVAYHSGEPYSLWMIDTATGGTAIDYSSVFRMYNFGLPDWDDSAETPAQVSGWNMEGQALAAAIDVKDYVQYETNLLVGNPRGPKAAHEALEGVPFECSYHTGATDLSVHAWTLENPNDYIALLNGLLEVRVIATAGDNEGESIGFLRVSAHISGWTSYMKGRRKKRSRRKGKK